MKKLTWHYSVCALITALLGSVQAQEPIAFTILLNEYHFQIEGQEANAPIVLEADTEYELTFKNVGTMQHEVSIGTDLTTVEGQANGYDNVLLKDVEVEFKDSGWEIEVFGVNELELEPGEALTMILEIPDSKIGEWENSCFVSGHYEAGMHAPFIVQ